MKLVPTIVPSWSARAVEFLWFVAQTHPRCQFLYVNCGNQSPLPKRHRPKVLLQDGKMHSTLYLKHPIPSQEASDETATNYMTTTGKLWPPKSGGLPPAWIGLPFHFHFHSQLSVSITALTQLFLSRHNSVPNQATKRLQYCYSLEEKLIRLMQRQPRQTKHADNTPRQHLSQKPATTDHPHQAADRTGSSRPTPHSYRKQSKPG